MTDLDEGSGRSSEIELTRRELLKATARFGAAAMVAGSVAGVAGRAASARSTTRTAFARRGGRKAATQLTIANLATPGNLDPEFGIGFDTYPHLLNLNDGLVRWQVVASNAPTVAGGTEKGGYDVNWGGARNARAISIPSLAESYSQSKDGTVWTFKIRAGITSHGGNELTAQDVKYLYDRAYGVKTINLFLSGIQRIHSAADVRVLDDRTVQLKTEFPTPLSLFCLNDTIRMAILDSTAMKQHASKSDPWSNGWLKGNDAGFGPYKLDSLTPGQQAVWTTHDRPLPKSVYVAGPPQFTQVTWRAVPEAASRVALLAKGEVDVALTLSPQQLRQLQKTSGVRVWNFPANSIAAVPLNFNFPPINNQKVRQALSYAVPYDAIVKDVYLGFARPCIAPVSDHNQSLPGRVLNYTYDIEKAKGLLKEAGFPNGFETKFTYPTNDPLAEQLAILLKSSFAKAGIKLDLNALPSAAYSQALTGGKSPLVYWNLGADVPDPSYTTEVFYHSTSSVNWSHYKNAQVDQIIESGRKIMNYQQRLAHHVKAWKIMANDPPWLYLAQPGFQTAARDSLSGINWDPGGGSRWDLVRSG
jgi:peptide/nickel transport system substrate-binding protein